MFNLKYDKYLQISYYQLDFAFIDKGINIEIDGEQHYLDKRIFESNIKKDTFLKENGWEVIRIRWSHYKKMSKPQRKFFIDELINYISNKEGSIPKIMDNNKFCIICGKKINKKSNMCADCNYLNMRKLKNRPSVETLLKDITEYGYSKTGRMYGVSYSTIRRWVN